MDTIIRDTNFKTVADNLKPDSRRRVVLPGSLVHEGIIYHVYYNDSGQILLDPQVAIPLSELWLFKNQDALESVKQGLLDAAQGRVSKVDLETL